MNRRGSVLLHVLVTGTIVALIAASLLRLSMMRFELSARAQGGAANKRATESGLSRMLTFWNNANTNCVSFSGYNCGGGAAGSCNCTCSPTDPKQATIVAGMSGGRCQLNITSSPLMP